MKSSPRLLLTALLLAPGALLTAADPSSATASQGDGLHDRVANKDRVTNLAGQDSPVMQACGHDIHMTVFTGAARALATLKDQWSGTLVFIGQPAEEIGVGARAMLAAGLYAKFPRPDYVLGV